MAKKQITSFGINTSDISAAGQLRQFTVLGDIKAEFMLQVFNTAGSFYNFNDGTFSAGLNSSEKSLKTSMTSKTFVGNIKFPEASATTYTILLFTPPDTNTELSSGLDSKNVHNIQISQVNDTIVTFALKTASGDNYSTEPPNTNVTSTASPVQTSVIPVDIDWTPTNKNNDGFGFGLRLTDETPEDLHWFFEATETVDGTTSSSTSVVVDDLTDLVVGMDLTYKTGTTVAATDTKITAIDIETKTLTLSVANSLTDGNTMTFRAYGSSLIQDVIGVNVDFGSFTATAAELTKTVRSDAASTTTVDLYGTYGISGGGFVTVSGANIVNTGTNTVQTVSASSGSGSIVVEVDQTGNGLAQGTKLYFTGSTQSVNILGTLQISQYPTSNRTIYLDLDKFITPGVSGS